MYSNHSSDFGYSQNWNKATGESFLNTVKNSIGESTVIQGTYRGNPATFFYNPGTGNVIITNTNGSLIGGWQFGQSQLNHLFTTGIVY